MKLLIINGSPRKKQSNSLKLTHSFVDGFKRACQEKGSEVEVEEVEVSSLNISACKGCFACWKNTPGQCVIKDDMQKIIEKQISADVIIWSFPLYYFNVPGSLKNLIDRQLPMSQPFMEERSDGYGNGTHPARYDMSGKKHVLISTCGFYTAKDNYDSVVNMFNHFLGKDRFEKIFCGQGELFRVKELSARTGEYLEFVKKAGREFAGQGIGEETKKELESLLYPKEIFEKMADASWGINKETGQKDEEDFLFTKQMAALYNKNAWDGKDRVLEMYYTDLNKSYQILLTREGSSVFTDGSKTTTTKIETPFDVWLSISQGKISGEEALAKNLYRVTGDFSLMMNWGKFFGSTGSGETQSNEKEMAGNEKHLKNPSMTTMLFPWIVFWVAVSINPVIGSLISLLVCAQMPLIMRRHRLIIWDQLSFVAVALLSLIANITKNGHLITNIGYLVFGLFWLSSCFSKEPLCAAYVKYSYGGEKALKNPLFMKPNYILAACWGIIYLLTAVWTYFLGRAGLVIVIPIINNSVPILMLIFTRWFSKWYPAHKAAGKSTEKATEK